METVTGLKVSLVPIASLIAAAPNPAAAVTVGEAMATLAQAQADITRWDLVTRPALQAEYEILRAEVDSRSPSSLATPYSLPPPPLLLRWRWARPWL